ncbi:MAG: iron ABC transporter permease [Atribacterota bacterium]|nr:iron ABC transporter permease [Atribacterota bacterium]MDD4895842.1 iron ABC transporter permease [Atribacterota bacterium]MDD5636707.1 iron ABC transporter permease [Atribacterota bacterium]
MDSSTNNRQIKEIIAQLKIIWKEPMLFFLIVIIFYFLITFIVFPIFQVVKNSMYIGGKWDFSNYIAIFSKRYFIQPFINSIVLGIYTATIGTIAGFTFAYALTRTSLPFKNFFRLTATFPIISPPFVVALAAILLFGRAGSLTPWLKSLIGNYSIYGLAGLVLVETIAYSPTAFMVLYGVLQAIDPSLEEASMDLGASWSKVFSTITLPLATPGIASAWLLVFIQSMADFGNPMVISGNFRVLSVQAYLQITGMYDLPRGSTLAMLLLLPTATAFFLQRYWVSRKSYVTVTGKPTGATVKNLNWFIKLLVYGACILYAGIVLLFYGTIVYGSFQTLWGVNPTLTLKNYIEMFEVGKNYLYDSVFLSSVATPITGIVGMFISYLIIRKKFIGRSLMEFISMLTFAVPGTVVGIGYILAFNQKSALMPVILTGTAWIIIILLIFRDMPVGIRSGIAALQQIDPAIEEASTDLGADSNTTFRKITLPMIAPAFFSGLAFGFVKAMTAISAIIFVVSGRWNLVTIAILGFVDNTQYARAAAMSIILIIIILIALGVIQFLVNRVGKGVRLTTIIE